MDKIISTFEGIATTDGDDPYCFGVHASWVNKNPVRKDIQQCSEIIDLLDKVFKEKEGKRLRVTVIIEELKE